MFQIEKFIEYGNIFLFIFIIIKLKTYTIIFKFHVICIYIKCKKKCFINSYSFVEKIVGPEKGRLIFLQLPLT